MKIVLLVILLISASPAWAVVAVDTTVTSSCVNCASDSFSHTVAGANRGMICTAHYTAADAGRSISAYTYNTIALTIIDSAVVALEGHALEMWQLIAPATGAHSAAVTITGGNANLVSTCTSVTGADQVTLIGTPASSTDTNTTATQNVTVPTGGLAIDAYHVAGNCPAPSGTEGAGQTEIFDLCDGDSSVAAYGSTSDTAGVNAMSYSWVVNGRVASMAVPINPVAAATAKPKVIFID